MKTLLLASLLFVTLFIKSQAQSISIDSLNAVYDRETIYLNGTNNKYVKNNQNKCIGFLGGKLKKEFENSSEPAKNEYGAFRKKMKHAFVASSATILIIAAGTIVVATFGIPVGTAVLATAIVPYTIAIIQGAKSQKSFYKAIWLHNKFLLTKNK